jgi:hypothetical protein
MRLDTGGYVMSRPISPTPELDKEEFLAFWEKVRKEEKQPVSLVRTPKLDELREKVLAKARSCKK